jgi:hypothetical protein
VQGGEHASHRRPVGALAERQTLHLDESLAAAHAVIEGFRSAYARGAQRAQAFGLGRIYTGEMRGLRRRTRLDEGASAQTPESRRLAIDRRSTRISMNARSNLCWQPSEACMRFCVGTEMMLASCTTLTSAPRTCSLLER